MCRKPLLYVAAVGLLPIAVGFVVAGPLTPLEDLGKHLFFDQNLSTPPGQSCAACHGPSVGFTGPVSSTNAAGAVYPGAVASRAGNRKPPTAAYAGDSPVLHFDAADETWVGGIFWDGRASGWTLGDPLAEQAEGPFLNPLEQNNPDAKSVVTKVSRSDYAGLFEQVWGPGSLDPVHDVAGSYERIARSIAAYERSAEVNPFTSKYDDYLRKQVKLSRQEMAGLRLFEGKAMCANCHPSQPGPNGEPPLFTDFTYDNLGVPRNPSNPFYSAPTSTNPAGPAWVDPGLGGFLASHGYADQAEENLGKQKVPTLRNVDKRPYEGFVKAYSHNGFFKSLEEIVHFYNTRDVGSWPPPEVAATVNHEELGNLGLSSDEEAAIVAFLKTLSDGYVLPATARRAEAPGSGGQTAGVATPGAVELAPLLRNPAHGTASVRFGLPAAMDAELALFDVSGRQLCTLASGSFGPGWHSVEWAGRDRNGSPVVSGVYYLWLHAGGTIQARPLVWLR